MSRMIPTKVITLTNLTNICYAGRFQAAYCSAYCSHFIPYGNPLNILRFSKHSIQKSLTSTISNPKVSQSLSEISSPPREQNFPVFFPVPLSEREPIHKCTLQELLEWRSKAKKAALCVGTSFEKEDGGPTAEELLVELDWLLEDTVTAIGGHEILWKFCKYELHLAPIESEVRLRADLHHEIATMWTARILYRIPFQYLVGSVHWRDFVISVCPGVLIPRPETEILVDFAEDAIRRNPWLAASDWADLGTGSGALAMGLGKLLTKGSGRVWAVDLSGVAIEVAENNVTRCGLQDKVTVLKGSWFSPLEKLRGKLGGVLSNPPYIPTQHLSGLQAEVGRYEPREALDGGAGEGMKEFVPICEGAAMFLSPGGFLGLETNGGSQAYLVAKFLEELPGSPFHNVKVLQDYSHVNRFVIASKRGRTDEDKG